MQAMNAQLFCCSDVKIKVKGEGWRAESDC